MRNLLKLTLIAMAVILSSCNGQEAKKGGDKGNPFFSDYDTPYGIAPFEDIKLEHYIPAFEKGIEEQNANIKKIVDNSEPANFSNTIEALEYSSPLLDKVSDVFYNMTGMNANDSIRAIASSLAPKLSQHSDDIFLNSDLFNKVKEVYDNRLLTELTPEQTTLLDKVYKNFVRSGAELTKVDKEKLSKINKQLSVLTLDFGNNVLAETNNFVMYVDSKDDLEGLPQSVIDAAAQTAKEKGQEGKWAFTTQKPSMIPFLQYAKNRSLRETLYKGYIMRGDNNNEYDNKEIAKQMANLRLEKANLLGYKNYAQYVLEKNMAKTPENVNARLDFLMEKSLKVAKQELADMQALVDKENGGFKIQSWDWWYYTEKIRKAKFDLDENEIKPYFELENVIKGAFYTANKLYGLEFKRRNDLPLPHPDARSYEVDEANGDFVGILYMDFFPRESKRGGAWMNSFRKQEVKDDEIVYPIITNVCNFTKPSGDTPALLSVDEAQTLFHEFGHGLHGLLSKCHYGSLSGTAVPRDFVELPSQMMEHWVLEPELLKVYAKHYKTGEVIPDELVKKIQAASAFNQGFLTTEYLGAAILDMDYHTITSPITEDINTFEANANKEMGLMPEIVNRYRSTYFNHIFAGGYSAGYYAYIWSAILDSDAFAAFKETGDIFNPEVAKRFRENILERGGTEDPEVMYENFRGAAPNEKYLLEDRGLDK